MVWPWSSDDRPEPPPRPGRTFRNFLFAFFSALAMRRGRRTRLPFLPRRLYGSNFSASRIWASRMSIALGAGNTDLNGRHLNFFLPTCTLTWPDLHLTGLRAAPLASVVPPAASAASTMTAASARMRRMARRSYSAVAERHRRRARSARRSSSPLPRGGRGSGGVGARALFREADGFEGFVSVEVLVACVPFPMCPFCASRRTRLRMRRRERLALTAPRL